MLTDADLAELRLLARNHEGTSVMEIDPAHLRALLSELEDALEDLGEAQAEIERLNQEVSDLTFELES